MVPKSDPDCAALTCGQEPRSAAESRDIASSASLVPIWVVLSFRKYPPTTPTVTGAHLRIMLGSPWSTTVRSSDRRSAGLANAQPSAGAGSVVTK